MWPTSTSDEFRGERASPAQRVPSRRNGPNPPPPGERVVDRRLADEAQADEHAVGGVEPLQRALEVDEADALAGVGHRWP